VATVRFGFGTGSHRQGGGFAGHVLDGNGVADRRRVVLVGPRSRIPNVGVEPTCPERVPASSKSIVVPAGTRSHTVAVTSRYCSGGFREDSET